MGLKKAHEEPGRPGWLTAMNAVAGSVARHDDARRERDNAIRRARAERVPLNDLSAVSGLSVSRLKQIARDPEEPLDPSKGSVRVMQATAGILDIDVPRAAPTVSSIAELAAAGQDIAAWESERAFLNADERRRPFHLVMSRLRDGADDPGEWVVKRCPATGEVYVYRTPPFGERLARVDQVDPRSRAEGWGDLDGPCYLLGRVLDDSLVQAAVERTDLIDRPGGVVWVYGRLMLLNHVLRALAQGPGGPAELPDRLDEYLAE